MYLNTILNIFKKYLFPFFLVILVGSAFLLIAPSHIPFLKFSIHTIKSESMEPSVKKGDAILVVESYQQYSLHDVITFSYSDDKYKDTITHRIIRVNEKDGTKYYETQGDNNNTADANRLTNDQILGKVEYTIPKIGNLVLFARSIMGIITLGIIPSTIALTLYAKDFVDSLQTKLTNLSNKKSNH